MNYTISVPRATWITTRQQLVHWLNQCQEFGDRLVEAGEAALNAGATSVRIGFGSGEGEFSLAY